MVNCLSQTDPPKPVQCFLMAIKDNKQLRWGGEFNKTDPAHIDDNYNQNATQWQARHEMIKKECRK
jgi:hypothetical protein